MATPSLTKHTVPGVLGDILVDVRAGDRKSPRPAVVIVHGFKGFKDWGMFPTLADRLARAGFVAVSFNLSGSGVDDRGEFVFPERFGHNTFSAELEDIQRVLAALLRGHLDLTPPSSLGLFGHSRGGGMALLAAANESRVRTLVTWAAISTVHRWPGQEEEWRTRGHMDIVNSRTGQVLPLHTDILDDINQHPQRLDLLAAARRFARPWLILHSREDETVPFAEATRLAEAAGSAAQLLEVGGGHVFGAAHPLTRITADLARAMDETVKWMARRL